MPKMNIFQPKGSRRTFLLMALLSFVSSCLAPARSVIAASQDNVTKEASDRAKFLVAYFSRSGNTRKLAHEIQKQLGADLFEIVPLEAYPDDYQKTVDQAKTEQRQNARPALKGELPDTRQYAGIFLGYPNWWGSMPMPVYSFVEKAGLEGKPVMPFCTHGGGGAGQSAQEIKKLLPKSKIFPVLALRGSAAENSAQEISQWLKRINLQNL